MPELEDHPLSEIFPLMGEKELADLGQAIERSGLRKPIVLHQGKILDGRNRYRACTAAKIKPRTRQYDEAKEGPPLRFVLDENMERRHLTTSQRATVAAVALKASQDEARAAAEAKSEAANAAVRDAADGVSKGKLEKEAPPAKKKAAKKKAAKKKAGRPKGEATQASVASQMAVSVDSVARAQELEKEAPDEFAAVQAGKKTLNEAWKSVEAKKEKVALEEKRKEILEELAHVCGAEFATAVANGVILKSVKELAAFHALENAEKKLIQNHVASGWTVKRALAQALDKIDAQSTIEELINKAIGAGGDFVTTVGEFEVSAYKLEKK